jgi:predicted nucleic acid-binding Zn ribbon protein
MKAIPTSETLCSDECKQKYQAMLKKKRLTILLLWVMMIAFIVILFLSQYI